MVDMTSSLHYQKMELPTALLADQWGSKAQVPDASWQSYGGRVKFHGTAATIVAADSVQILRDILQQPGRQRILVVDGGSTVGALVNEEIGRLAASNRWAGIVLRGKVRNVAILKKIPIGILALGSSPLGATPGPLRDTASSQGTEVNICGAVCAAGDRVYVDEDGAVFLPPEVHNPVQFKTMDTNDVSFRDYVTSGRVVRERPVFTGSRGHSATEQTPWDW